MFITHKFSRWWNCYFPQSRESSRVVHKGIKNTYINIVCDLYLHWSANLPYFALHGCCQVESSGKILWDIFLDYRYEEEKYFFNNQRWIKSKYFERVEVIIWKCDVCVMGFFRAIVVDWKSGTIGFGRWNRIKSSTQRIRCSAKVDFLVKFDKIGKLVPFCYGKTRDLDAIIHIQKLRIRFSKNWKFWELRKNPGFNVFNLNSVFERNAFSFEMQFTKLSLNFLSLNRSGKNLKLLRHFSKF